jgi:ankyrin repeat protein
MKMSKDSRNAPVLSSEVMEERLMRAASCHSELVELLESGFPVDSRDKNGGTALIYASQAGDAEIVKHLIGAGASLEESDCYGMTAAMGAARCWHADCLGALLSAGCRVSERGELSALLNVVMSASDLPVQAGEACARMLLEAGAGLSIEEDDGGCLARIADRYGHGSLALMIRSEGAERERRAISDASESDKKPSSGRLRV